jgi:hypothetical protein
MDTLVIFAIIGIVVLVFVIVATLYLSLDNKVQTKEAKRQQIIVDYKRQLRDELEPLKDNKEAMLATKSTLLNRFSKELAMNIFFDKDEIRDIMLDLSKV